MTRVPRFVIPCLAATAILAFGTPASAQGRKVVVQPRYRVMHSQMPALPGYYMLRMEHVQKELELVPDQLDKLKELGKQYYEQMRADQGAWKNWKEMTPEERTAKTAEMREKYKQRADELRKKIELVLLPHQLQALKEINFRAAGPSALANPRTLKDLEVTDEQKEELQKIRQEMIEKYQELQKKAFERSLKVLAPEQQKKLKERIQTRGY